jgi:hypothetical protein
MITPGLASAKSKNFRYTNKANSRKNIVKKNWILNLDVFRRGSQIDSLVLAEEFNDKILSEFNFT